jgi:alkanesulfonate monooxygenase SsuD/methylene tetrahydromethanopterin reductase-like flavin-dependent oxidoreductase (luciferase family)
VFRTPASPELERFFDQRSVVIPKSGLGYSPFSALELYRAEKEPLNVPYVGTPQIVVDRILELAEVKLDDTVYDLGGGDSRVASPDIWKSGYRVLKTSR